MGSMHHNALTVWPEPIASDAALIEAIATGSEDALDEFIRRHRRSVFTAVVRILTCVADAEEVVQDVFFLVWTHALRFRAESKVTTWLHAISRNAAMSRLRVRQID